MHFDIKPLQKKYFALSFVVIIFHIMLLPNDGELLLETKIACAVVNVNINIVKRQNSDKQVINDLSNSRMFPCHISAQGCLPLMKL